MNIERQVVGEILANSDECLIAFEELKEEHFQSDSFRKIFTQMASMNKVGEQIDIMTLTEKGLNSESLMVLASEIVSAAHIKSHVKILKDRYYLRTAVSQLTEALSRASKPGATTENLRTNIEETALFLSNNVKSKGLQHISVAMASSLKQLEQISQGDLPGVKTGFRDLDNNGFFFKDKTLTIIAARPAMGKSALAWAIARKCKKKVGFFSLEMAKEEQAERSISADTGISNDDMKNRHMMKENIPKILEASYNISKETIWINDDTKVTISTIHNQCKRMIAKEGLELLIVDYMGLVESMEKFAKRNLEVGAISKGLKYIANDLGIPVVALCQLNRDCEARNDKRPLLSDLRESGDMEQDAHMVIFIYRDEVYNEDTEEKGVAEIIVRKNRAGKTGIIKLNFDGPRTTFSNYDSPSEVYGSPSF